MSSLAKAQKKTKDLEETRSVLEMMNLLQFKAKKDKGAYSKRVNTPLDNHEL